MRFILEFLFIVIAVGVVLAIRFCMRLYAENTKLRAQNDDNGLTMKRLSADLEKVKHDFKRREEDPFYVPERE